MHHIIDPSRVTTEEIRRQLDELGVTPVNLAGMPAEIVADLADVPDLELVAGYLIAAFGDGVMDTGDVPLGTDEATLWLAIGRAYGLKVTR